MKVSGTGISDKEICQEISLAIIERAILDWKMLCSGHPETKWCNFHDLRNFFKNDCQGYMRGGRLSAKGILELLEEELRKSRAPG